MKVLYSQLKHYLPELAADYTELGKVFTSIGYMQDGAAEEVTYKGKPDFFIDLEVRQNRADCFGVLGLARELSAYYNIPLIYPLYKSLSTYITSQEKLPIQITAKKAVKRVMAVTLSNITIGESPDWLKEYLTLYEINTINNLVDLTNYVMLETAHASHVFDTDLVGKKLIWELNDGKYDSIETLQGIELTLEADTLVISDGKRPLSLSFIGGGVDAVHTDTKNILLEMAIYDGGLVRKNSRRLKTITEAGSRLEKFLDPETIPQAFEMLLSLIIEHCGGTVSSSIFDEYLQKEVKNVLSVSLDTVQQIAGVSISYDESKTYLERLGFEIVDVQLPLIHVRKPVNRLDLEQSEDVYEEIIRMYGYDHIPTDNLLQSITKDVTPSHLRLLTNWKTQLINNGFDEVRSWAMVDEQKNQQSNFTDMQAIRVTNAINDEVPILRQTIGVSLLGQAESMKRNFIDPIRISEEGKVFSKKGTNYIEYYALGGLSTDLSFDELRLQAEALLLSEGFSDIFVKPAHIIPAVAHPQNCFSICVRVKNIDHIVGMIYKTNKTITLEACVFEIIVDTVDELKTQIPDTKSTYEIVQKLVSLDVNITLDTSADVRKEIAAKLEPHKDNVWNWIIIDSFPAANSVKYTVRVTYMQLGDVEAKKLHESIFA